MGRWDRIGFACVILNKIVLSVVKMIFSSFSRISTIFHRKTPTIVKDTEECASHMTPDAVKHAKRGNVTAESLKIEFTGTSIKNRSFQNIFMELQLRFVLYFLSLLHEKRNLVSKNSAWSPHAVQELNPNSFPRRRSRTGHEKTPKIEPGNNSLRRTGRPTCLLGNFSTGSSHSCAFHSQYRDPLA